MIRELQERLRARLADIDRGAGADPSRTRSSRISQSERAPCTRRRRPRRRTGRPRSSPGGVQLESFGPQSWASDRLATGQSGSGSTRKSGTDLPGRQWLERDRAIGSDGHDRAPSTWALAKIRFVRHCVGLTGCVWAPSGPGSQRTAALDDSDQSSQIFHSACDHTSSKWLRCYRSTVVLMTVPSSADDARRRLRCTRRADRAALD